MLVEHEGEKGNTREKQLTIFHVTDRIRRIKMYASPFYLIERSFDETKCKKLSDDKKEIAQYFLVLLVLLVSIQFNSFNLLP